MFSEHIGRYDTYGIAVFDTAGAPLGAVGDVSVDRSLVEGIAALCNAQQLEPLHLLDVVHNFI